MKLIIDQELKAKDYQRARKKIAKYYESENKSFWNWYYPQKHRFTRKRCQVPYYQPSEDMEFSYSQGYLSFYFVFSIVFTIGSALFGFYRLKSLDYIWHWEHWLYLFLIILGIVSVYCYQKMMKNPQPQLIINYKGIERKSYRSFFIPWEDVLCTLILENNGGNGSNYFLLIHLKQEVKPKRIALNGLEGGVESIETYIELYKKYADKIRRKKARLNTEPGSQE